MRSAMRESCLEIVRGAKLGEIVGSPTAGTNGTVNRFQLPGDYTVLFTGTKVLKHDGSRPRRRHHADRCGDADTRRNCGRP